MNRLKIRKVGSSAGIVLPKEVLIKLNCQQGDELFVIETPNGIELTPFDPDFEKGMETARTIMVRNKNLLKKLAE